MSIGIGAFDVRALPPKKGGFKRDSVSAQLLMAELNFDPIQKLIDVYVDLEREIQLLEEVRSGEVVQITKNGGVLRYSPKIHYELYDRLITISEALLRYRYARVNEAIIEDSKAKRGALIVHLSNEGDTFQIGNTNEDED
jgi:hypothetical protein